MVLPSFRDPSNIDLNVIVGFILNVPSDYKFGFITLPLRKRHWIAVRQIDGKFYNLDSKLHTPECIGNEQQLFAFLKQQIQSNDRELFVIVETSSSANDDSQPQPKKWLREPLPSPSNEDTTSIGTDAVIDGITNPSLMNGHVS